MVAGVSVGAVVKRSRLVGVPRLTPTNPAEASVPSERLAKVRVTVPEPVCVELKRPPIRTNVRAAVLVSTELAALPT